MQPPPLAAQFEDRRGGKPRQRLRDTASANHSDVRERLRADLCWRHQLAAHDCHGLPDVVLRPDPAGRLRGWARAFVGSNPTDTLALLKDLSAGVSGWICYQSREDEGTQSPTQTLDRGWGSCRDFAVLFVEAARCLGFGARIVSGYLYNPDQNIVGSTDAGSTHAWAEVYVPGAGWITFDPTNRSVGGFNLIPVAVARDIRRAMPVAGSFVGTTDAFQGMSVGVLITA